MRTILACFLGVFICSCSEQNGEETFIGESGHSPTVIISVQSTPQSSLLPWSISHASDCISGAVIMPGNPLQSYPDEFEFISEAAARNLLIAVVNDTLLSSSLGSDHLKIWSDTAGRPATLPDNLLSDTADSSWTDPVARQEILFRLFDLYKPDIIFIRLEYTDIQDQISVAEFWTSQEMLQDYTVIMYSLSADSQHRGWAFFAGKGINGTIPMGLTNGGVISTTRLLMGLGWENYVPDRIPAFSILLDPESSWTE